MMTHKEWLEKIKKINNERLKSLNENTNKNQKAI